MSQALVLFVGEKHLRLRVLQEGTGVMLADTLRALDGDVERLLMAGAGSAPSDEGLLARGAAFGEPGKKVPQLAKVAEQIGKVGAKKGRGAAEELLNLSAMNLRLRGAQVTPVKPTGDLVALPETAPMETPLGTHDIEPLYRALSGVAVAGVRVKAADGGRILKDVIERGAVGDLRLLRLWVDALGKPNLGDDVAEQVLPRLGRAALPLLRADFRLDGTGQVDLRRLQGIVAIEANDALPLVKEALEQGSPPVRGWALPLLLSLDPALGEAEALALVTSKSKELREAAVRVLGRASSPASLEALVVALRDIESVQLVAADALAQHKHPETGARLFALLTDELLNAKPYAAPKVKKGVKLTPAAQKAQGEAISAAEEKIMLAVSLLRALGGHSTPAVIERLLAVASGKREGVDERIDLALYTRLLESNDRRALELLMRWLESDDDTQRGLGIAAFVRLDPSTVTARAAPYFDFAKWPTAAKARAKAARTVTMLLSVPLTEEEDYENDFDREYLAMSDQTRQVLRSDPAWAELALRALDVSDVASTAVAHLRAIDDLRSTESLLAFLSRADVMWADDIANILADRGERRAVPHILRHLQSKKMQSFVREFVDALRRIGDSSAVPALTDLMKAAKKSRKNDHVRLYSELIEQLQGVAPPSS